VLTFDIKQILLERNFFALCYPTIYYVHYVVEQKTLNVKTLCDIFFIQNIILSELTSLLRQFFVSSSVGDFPLLLLHLLLLRKAMHEVLQATIESLLAT
jgi:hypothetical protein